MRKINELYICFSFLAEKDLSTSLPRKFLKMEFTNLQNNTGDLFFFCWFINDVKLVSGTVTNPSLYEPLVLLVCKQYLPSHV